MSLLDSIPAMNDMMAKAVEFKKNMPEIMEIVQDPMSILRSYENKQGVGQMGMQEQAMAIVDEFRKTFMTFNNNLKEIYDLTAKSMEYTKEQTEAIKELAEIMKKSNL